MVVKKKWLGYLNIFAKRKPV